METQAHENKLISSFDDSETLNRFVENIVMNNRNLATLIVQRWLDELDLYLIPKADYQPGAGFKNSSEKTKIAQG